MKINPEWEKAELGLEIPGFSLDKFRIEFPPAVLCAWCGKILSGGDWSRVSHGTCGICALVFVSEQIHQWEEDPAKRKEPQGDEKENRQNPS